MKIAVLVSGGGTNLQALIDYQKSNADCPYTISLVISNTKNAYALERAKNAKIPAEIRSPFSILGKEKAEIESNIRRLKDEEEENEYAPGREGVRLLRERVQEKDSVILKKVSSFNHLAEQVLPDRQRRLLLDAGQLGEVGGVYAGDFKVRVAAGHAHGEAVADFDEFSCVPEGLCGRNVHQNGEYAARGTDRIYQCHGSGRLSGA